MKYSRMVGFMMFAVLVLGSVIAPHARAGSSAFILLSSYYSAPNQSVFVLGYMFDPGETVTISFGGTVVNVAADASGNFTSPPITVPMSAAGGNISISATGVDGDHNTANLSVAGYYPLVTPSSYHVLPGGSVSFTGVHFAPNENVTITNGGGTSSVIADGSGSFTTQNFPVGWSCSTRGF